METPTRLLRIVRQIQNQGQSIQRQLIVEAVIESPHDRTAGRIGGVGIGYLSKAGEVHDALGRRVALSRHLGGAQSRDEDDREPETGIAHLLTGARLSSARFRASTLMRGSPRRPNCRDWV